MSYRDEIWYRKLEQDVRNRREQFTDKQWDQYQMEHLLRVADRVRQFSTECETCREFQPTLTRLEEEMQELPGSKAQRQWQAQQLAEMGQHFVAAHQIVPPRYFRRKRLRTGALVGLGVGLITSVITGYVALLPLGLLAGAVAGALTGATEDQKVEREHRQV